MGRASGLAAFCVLALCLGGASCLDLISSGIDLTAEQRSLLEQLELAGGSQAAPAAGASSHAASRKLSGFPLPIGTPDAPSIDIFSWAYAARMEDLVVGSGYPLKVYKVPTWDGYILNMYRIPHGKYRNTEPGPKPVVLLQHGVTLASNSFTLFNANESMAYILADAGFDVFLSNSRGNTYSRGHKWLNSYGSDYWRFSMDELALIDLPAQIDKALAVTGAPKLSYIGHSQGCTLMYMLLSDKVKYNKKIALVVHVGPVAFIEYIRAPFLKAQPKIRSDQWLKNAPLGDFLAHRDLSPFFMPFCGHNKTFNEWCTQQLNGMFYGPSVFVPTADYWLVGSTWPSTVSSRNLEHWSQMDRDGELELRKYSYGNDCTNLLRGSDWPRNFHESCNMAMYGTTIPPAYNFSKITVPQAFFLGTIDIMSVPEDVTEQMKRLNPNVTIVTHVYERYSHMDFVWDRNALYKEDLVDLLFRYADETMGTGKPDHVGIPLGLKGPLNPLGLNPIIQG